MGELAVLDALTFFYHGILVIHILTQVIPVIYLRGLCPERLHDQCLLFGRTNICTVTAAGTVKDRDLYPVIISLKNLSLHCNARQIPGLFLQILVIEQEWTDGGMRANIGTLVALGAFFRLPFGYICCNSPFFVLSCSWRECTIFPAKECTYRQVISPEGVDRMGHVFNKIRYISPNLHLLWREFCPRRIYLYLMYLSSPVNSCKIHIHHIFTLAPVTLDNELTHFFHRLCVGDNLRDLEEC